MLGTNQLRSFIKASQSLPALLLLFSLPVTLSSREKDVQKEERQDYFEKWLAEDATLIISPEERSVFEHLSSPEEKERFIEQFWLRRDTNPGTAHNEFKEEHYRRIAFANERFRYGGFPGWKTDRGRTYIKSGPPDAKESHPFIRAKGRSLERIPLFDSHSRLLEFPGLK